MESLDRRLVRRDSRLIQLLDPPFDTSNLDPGYIKGYVPGVRENGGQYTHAAVWAAMAFAESGDSEKAWELEPYVMAADVYGRAPHTGRGGWTWYTGSAGWMYRLVIESLLGLRLEKDMLHIQPCPRKDWDSYMVHYRYRETVYHLTVITIREEDTPTGVIIDGEHHEGMAIHLVDDHEHHEVEVRTRPQR